MSDHAAGIEHVLRHGAAGETYNVPGGNELPNREVVRRILERLGKPWSLVRQVADRPGHDRRYAMDGSKLAALGWRHRSPFDEGLAATVDWFVANEAWWRAIKAGDWDAYYERQYGARLAASSAPAGAIRPRRADVRVAVTGAGGRLGRALVAALADAPFTGPPGRSAGPDRTSTSTTRRRLPALRRPRPAGGRRPRRGLDRRRRLRPRPGAGPPPQRRRDAGRSPTPARRPAWTSS